MSGGVPGLGGALDEGALDELLQRIVVLACHTVGAAHSVSLTVPDGEGFRTSNYTESVALLIDEVQYEQNDGPCLQALRSGRQVRLTIGADDGRWPPVEAKAQELGVTAVLSTPLVRSAGDSTGALNIYSRGTGGFTEDEMQTASLIGEHAAVLVGSILDLRGATVLNQQLREALASREIIGEAKGIIMERQGCSRDEAFHILRRASQRENRKLRDLAEELVARVEARRSGPAPR